MSSKIDHKLVTLAYFLGNDLDDNLEYHSKQASKSKVDPRHEPTGSSWYETLKGINDGVRRAHVYNLMYHALRSAFGRPSLSP
jgi:hypothetical protein